MPRRILGTALLILLVSMPGWVLASRRAPERAAAESLYSTGMSRLAQGSLAGREDAVRLLKQAVQLVPSNPRYHRALGRALLESRYDHGARAELDEAVRLDGSDASARLLLVTAWKRELMATFDPAAVDSALSQARLATEADPRSCEAQIEFAVLSYEHGQVAQGAAAADRALELDPQRPEAALAAAYLGYRTGSLSRAESLFVAAIPRLGRELRTRFEDVRLLMSDSEAADYDALPAPQRAEARRRFWNRCDPDPTTAVNEALLEYWSRVAHATFMSDNLGRHPWDVRTDLYSRFGGPASIAYEPPSLPSWELRRHARHGGFVHGVWVDMGLGLSTPYEALVLDYPKLGMRAVVQDVSLGRDFILPDQRDYDPEPVPSPSGLGDSWVMAPGGRAVFPLLPPGTHTLPISGSLATFEGPSGPRLIAQIETPGSPSDTIWGDAVVVDSSERTIARASVALSASTCDPSARRSAQFDFEVPPGDHRIALSVHDARGARGLIRTQRHVAPAPAVLSMSDLVLTCGSTDAMTSGNAVRLNPNLSGESAGDQPMLVYFELYHLTPASDGRTRFEYHYRVLPSARTHRRKLPSADGSRARGLDVRRTETSTGTLRRQFLSIPIRDLAPGDYDLAVEVRDLQSERRTVGHLAFSRN